MFTVDASIWVAAADPSDRFHSASMAFLREMAAQPRSLHDPALVLIEVGCALSRRARDAAVGADAVARLRTHPQLVLRALDEACLDLAIDLGTRHQLRAVDAIYAATAALCKAPLVTWDQELVVRTKALTPESWRSGRARPQPH